jgi:hypothetical protein
MMHPSNQILVGEVLASAALRRLVTLNDRPETRFMLRRRPDGTHTLSFNGEVFELPEWNGCSKEQATALTNVLIERSLPPHLVELFEPIR